jgi:iron complex outermembrane receptor protein
VDTLHAETTLFELGAVTVTGKQLSPLETEMNAEQLESNERLTMSEALDILPGIHMAELGQKNESSVYIRGFDLRQIPVFIDGIPVYIPYEGYLDLGRFTTFDVSKITIEKGPSTVLYGSNAFGGVINILTRKPTEKLDIQASAGILTGGFRTHLNLGTRQEKYYVQTSLSYMKRDYLLLSDKYESNEYEDGGKRDNSYTKDQKAHLKFGYTPKPGQEYAIAYTKQAGEKGNPVYAGDDPFMRQRYWQWPTWDKESIYLLSSNSIGNKSILKTRFYYDQFDNALHSYDDDTYSSQTRPYAFQSFYDDHSFGGNLLFQTEVLSYHNLKLAVFFKQDSHIEYNDDEPAREFMDQTISVALEDENFISDNWILTSGVGFNIRKSLRADDFDFQTGQISDFPINDDEGFHLQLGVQHLLQKRGSLSLNWARKTRFATMKDRYSYRLGRSIPNPSLDAETVQHFSGIFEKQFDKLDLNIKSELYFSYLNNVIQEVNLDDDPNLIQVQNTGKAEYYGLDLNMGLSPTNFVRSGMAYSFIKRENRSDPDLKFVNVPDHQFMLYSDIDFFKYLSAHLRYSTNSERYSTSYGIKVKGFSVLDLILSSQILPKVKIKAGIKNLTDINYELVEGYPSPGRQYFMTITYGR